MKWILLGIVVLVLIVIIAVLLLWHCMQQSIRDKGGMENPSDRIEREFTIGEENTDNTSGD